MGFIGHIDLIFTSARRHHDLFAQVTDVIDTSIRGCIYLYDVEGVTRSNLTTLQAFIARLTVFRVATIDGFGQQTCGTGFTGAPGSSKEIGMFYIITLESIFKRTNNWLLTNKIVKSLRTPLAVERLRGHATTPACNHL